MDVLWHLVINIGVLILSVTWAVSCYEEKKPFLWAIFLLLVGILFYGVHIYFGYSDGTCNNLTSGGMWQRLGAIEDCIDSYSQSLLFAQSAIIGSMLVWLVRAWSR